MPVSNMSDASVYVDKVNIGHILAIVDKINKVGSYDVGCLSEINDKDNQINRLKQEIKKELKKHDPNNDKIKESKKDIKLLKGKRAEIIASGVTGELDALNAYMKEVSSKNPNDIDSDTLNALSKLLIATTKENNEVLARVFSDNMDDGLLKKIIENINDYELDKIRESLEDFILVQNMKLDKRIKMDALNIQNQKKDLKRIKGSINGLHFSSPDISHEKYNKELSRLEKAKEKVEADIVNRRESLDKLYSAKTGESSLENAKFLYLAHLVKNKVNKKKPRSTVDSIFNSIRTFFKSILLLNERYRMNKLSHWQRGSITMEQYKKAESYGDLALMGDYSLPTLPQASVVTSRPSVVDPAAPSPASRVPNDVEDVSFTSYATDQDRIFELLKEVDANNKTKGRKTSFADDYKDALEKIDYAYDNQRRVDENDSMIVSKYEHIADLQARGEYNTPMTINNCVRPISRYKARRGSRIRLKVIEKPPNRRGKEM